MSVNFSTLTSLLEQEHQLFVRQATEPASSIWKTSFKTFAKDLEMYVHPFGLKMKSSWGQGKWAYFPWICLYLPKMSTDPKNGIFIDYLFGWEDHEVLLTLLQGVDGKLKDYPNKIDDIKKLVQSKIDCTSFSKTMFDASPVKNEIPSKCNRAKSYAAGMIFHKKYTSSSLPESRRLEADLNEIINIYTAVKK